MGTKEINNWNGRKFIGQRAALSKDITAPEPWWEASQPRQHPAFPSVCLSACLKGVWDLGPDAAFCVWALLAAAVAQENSPLFRKDLGTPAAFLCEAEARRCLAPVVDVVTSPASQGEAIMLERLSQALCFPHSSERKASRCAKINKALRAESHWLARKQGGSEALF